MRPAIIHWLTLAGCVVLAGVALVLGAPVERPSGTTGLKSPLAALPPGPTLVVSADLERLAQGSGASALLRRGAGLLGAGRECEIATLGRARQIAVSVAGDGAALDMALVATGGFDADSVARCAEEAIRAKGGAPVRTPVGTFSTVRDPRSQGEVAVRDGGPLVLSGGGYLRNILSAAEGKELPAGEIERTRDRIHAELRRSFGRGAAVIATATLAPGWLERWLGDREARFSPLSRLRSAALRVEPEREGWVAEAVLAHETAPAAEQVGALARELGAAFAPWLEERLGPRASARLLPRRQGADLHVTLHLTKAELDRLFEW